jgi:hypothetical protein
MQATLPLEVQAEVNARLDGLPDNQEKARKALDDLISRALAYRSGAELKALFDFMRRFPHIAPYNAMLLHVQNPGIQFALRAPVWERKYERRVNSGARAYVILQTMGPVAFVFDLCDTQAINPKRDLIPAIVTNPFPTKGQPPAGALQNLVVACLQIGIVVQEQHLAIHHAGRATRFWNGTFGITLNSKHTEAQRVGTVAHELAHIFCGHLGAVKGRFWLDNSNAPEDVREFEAEAVAYLVTDRLNLDIGSVEYLAGYLSGDKPLPDSSLDTVLKAVGKIEEMLRGTFRVRRSAPRKKAGYAGNYRSARSDSEPEL